MAVLWYFAAAILTLLHQNESAVALVCMCSGESCVTFLPLIATFARASILGLLPLIWYRGLEKCLQNQGEMIPSVAVGFVLFFLNLFLNWAFINGLGAFYCVVSLLLFLSERLGHCWIGSGDEFSAASPTHCHVDCHPLFGASAIGM